MNWKPYVKQGITEMRPYIPGEDLTGVSVSDPDVPERDGGMIARNPANRRDRWFIASKYFKEHYVLAKPPVRSVLRRRFF